MAPKAQPLIDRGSMWVFYRYGDVTGATYATNTPKRHEAAAMMKRSDLRFGEVLHLSSVPLQERGTVKRIELSMEPNFSASSEKARQP
jgi:hypothetical protein